MSTKKKSLDFMLDSYVMSISTTVYTYKKKK